MGCSQAWPYQGSESEFESEQVLIRVFLQYALAETQLGLLDSQPELVLVWEVQVSREDLAECWICLAAYQLHRERFCRPWGHLEAGKLKMGCSSFRALAGRAWRMEPCQLHSQKQLKQGAEVHSPSRPKQTVLDQAETDRSLTVPSLVSRNQFLGQSTPTPPRHVVCRD